MREIRRRQFKSAGLDGSIIDGDRDMKTMIAKTALVLVLLLPGIGQSTAAEAALSRNEIKRLVVVEAEAPGVPVPLALALAKIESDFQDHVLSSKGARGVMQIMPKTARDEFGIEPDELWDARLNVQLGLDFLSQLHARYGGRWDLALSHYNGGTLKGRGADAQPHSYTRRYVEKVLRWRQRYADQANVWRTDRAKPAKDGWTPARTRAASASVASPRLATRTHADRRSRGFAEVRQIETVDLVALDDFASGRVARWLRMLRPTEGSTSVVRWW